MSSWPAGWTEEHLEDFLAEVGRQILTSGWSPEDARGCVRLDMEVCPADGVGGLVQAGACRVGARVPDPVRLGDTASYLDHTLLRPDATVEEIDEDEAQRIELENLRKRQEEAKAKAEQDKKEGKDEKKEEGYDDEEEADKAKKEKEALLQKPNAGNGGYTERYTWNQTLEEVTALVKLPPGTTAK